MRSLLQHVSLLPLLAQMLALELGDPPVDPPTPDPPTPPTPPAGLTDEMKAYFATQLEEARNQAKADFEADAQRKIDEAEAEAKRQADIAAGNFQQVEADYKAEIENLQVFKTRATALEAQVLKDYETSLAELPKVILAFKPKDDASIDEKLAWLETAKTQAAEIGPAPGVPGLRPDNIRHIPVDKVREEQARQDARSAVRRSI